MARVVFITTSYPSWPGDPSGHFVELEATARARRGDTVVVLAPGARASRADGVTLIALPGASAFGWPGALERVRERPYRALAACAFVASARHKLRELGAFDEVVAHWILPSGFPIAFDGTGALEVVLHGSDVRLLARLPRRLRLRIVERLIARGARFRFVSRALRDDCVGATTPAILARSIVLPCPVDVTGAPSRDVARAELGIAADDRLAVITGRLIAGKRPLEAVRLALERSANRVVVVGDGPLRAEVQKADCRVMTVGMQSRAAALAWIAAADYLVSASRLEGSPTAIREARALGVPVVTAPCGDVGEWARFDAGIEVVHAWSL